jgi:pimeloyl-ACP methyl ester carboxylesterase
MITAVFLSLTLLASPPSGPGPIRVTVALDAAHEVNMSDVVARLAEATKLKLERPTGELKLATEGVSGGLVRKMLAETLGPDVSVSVEPRALVLTLAPRLREERSRGDWHARVKGLADQTQTEIDRRARYGMHALDSYRPNDPDRPTICLIHGVNSSSRVFVHMIPLLEKAGFGLVVYDFPYNQRLEKSCAEFTRDWRAFRLATGDRRPWAIVAHSMGSLLARWYVEDPRAYDNDVSSLIMIAPVNQGSNMAKAQVAIQLLRRLPGAEGHSKASELAHLGDGLGEAAADMLPGSAFFKVLNDRPRRKGVAYHILAGDRGMLPNGVRKIVNENPSPFLRVLFRAIPDPDEYTDGFGDGCVSVARSKLEGVSDHVTIHANHAELIRAPLFYPDPGPVVAMPYVLRWLGASDGDRSGPAQAPRQ